MSRNEDFDNAFWDEGDIDALSAWATLLYIWSWTNRRCGMSGLYSVPRHRCTESKVPADHLDAAFAELATAEMLFYEDGWLWVKARVKHVKPRSTQMAKSIRSDLGRVPSGHPFLVRFMDRYADASWLRDALGDLRSTVSRTSGDVHGSSDEHGQSVNVTPPSPEVQLNLQCKGKGKGLSSEGKGGVGGKGAAKVDLPDDFPADLRPHLTVAYRVLRSLAERHNAKEVNVLSLAQVIMARPLRPLVKGAYDCAAHWDGQPQPVKDTVAAYRNWIDRTSNLATTERLTTGGLPGADVVPLRPSSKFSHFDTAAGLND